MVQSQGLVQEHNMSRFEKVVSGLLRAGGETGARTSLVLLAGLFLLGGCGMERIQPCGRIVDHRGKNRLLLVFSPSPRDSRLAEQRTEIQRNRDGLLERDMVVYQMVIDGQSYCEGGPIDVQTAHEIRRQFGVPDDSFQVILVGKDGAVKLRRVTSTRLWKVFSLIDAMPMRQQEMRERGGKT